MKHVKAFCLSSSIVCSDLKPIHISNISQATNDIFSKRRFVSDYCRIYSNREWITVARVSQNIETSKWASVRIGFLPTYFYRGLCCRPNYRRLDVRGNKTSKYCCNWTMWRNAIDIHRNNRESVRKTSDQSNCIEMIE